MSVSIFSVSSFIFYILFSSVCFGKKFNPADMFKIMMDVPVRLEKVMVSSTQLKTLAFMIQQGLLNPLTPQDQLQQVATELSVVTVNFKKNMTDFYQSDSLKNLSQLNNQCGQKPLVMMMAAPYVGQLPASLCSKLQAMDFKISSFFIQAQNEIHNALMLCEQVFLKNVSASGASSKASSGESSDSSASSSQNPAQKKSSTPTPKKSSEDEDEDEKDSSTQEQTDDEDEK